MMIEIFFENTDSVDGFTFSRAKNFITDHVHDIDLKFKYDKVIYLYRNPIDTIFSLLKYNKIDINNKAEITRLTKQYSDNVFKWFVSEGFTSNKLIISYEEIKENIKEQFKKISNFLNLEFKEENIKKIKNISKKDMKSKTEYDKQIVNVDESYNSKRDEFTKKQSKFIMEIFFERHPELKKFFNNNI
jgi:50S ribosomal subunit-associated GTPase HflX